MQSYEAILFDFDGVLVDSEPIHYECWLEVMRPYGLTLDYETYCRECIGISDRLMAEFVCHRASPPLPFETLWSEYPRKRQLVRDRMLAADPVSVATRDLIADLRPQFKIAVVTSSGETEVRPILERAGLLPMLDTVVYGGDVRNHKPHPEPYLLALERLGVARALAVEDSKAGIASARAAGLDVVEIDDPAQMVSRVREALHWSTHAGAGGGSAPA